MLFSVNEKIPKRKQRVLQSLADFATVILISCVFLTIFLIVKPFPRGFYCTDESIRFPYKGDTVPLWAAGLYGVISATLFVLISELYLARPCCSNEESFDRRQNRFILNSIHGVLLYALGAISTLLITEVGKQTIGRLRPHFLDVCQPNWSNITCFTNIQGVNVANYVPLTEVVCTGDPAKIKEARLSFPSGHSSFSTYSMIFLIIYLEARLVLQRTRFIKSIIQLIAFLAAWHTCMSRVSDFKHHYTDVISGAVIGFSVAIFVTVIIGKKIWYHSKSMKNKIKQVESLEQIDDDDDQKAETFELP
ncbi:phosphatidate phosphatase [Brachionus plicatilis]|uniref:Phosphatidate phosphatase n=1 Tax=Brachionus plicatilis TaxID=10195 RepID=A0A3M7RNV2_BRAPC|nr:phosphatidate phosphatase [Brachionus plicatilis]